MKISSAVFEIRKKTMRHPKSKGKKYEMNNGQAAEVHRWSSPLATNICHILLFG